MRPLEDQNLHRLEALPSPARLKRELPPTPAIADTVLAARSAFRDALHGRDAERLVVIAGPCSIHDAEASLEYARRLARVADQTGDALLLVMRTYFEKPRTTVGWKGLVNDPSLDGSCDVERGLRAARQVLLEVNAMGLPCATELLDPVTPQYLADLLAWTAIGARTAESQTHREMASGLSMPVGIKNGTQGSVQVALDAIVSASHPHRFFGIDAEGGASVVHTRGNPDTHLVLRGGSDGPNHDALSVAAAARETAARGTARGVMVDCSHGNSRKDHRVQPATCREVLEQVRDGAAGILGMMLESHLVGGRQDWAPGGELAYGVSITDACLGWEETEPLLHEAAEAVRSRRGRPTRSGSRHGREAAA
jgi:3-deoxy-7-phosphoheptulonate synthase